MDSGAIISPEKFWVDHQPFLLLRGYKLRPRYDPTWTPSWTHQQSTNGKKNPINRYEDSLPNPRYALIDAIRVRDNKKVVLKRVRTWTEEVPIAMYLSTQPMLSESRNRSVPILDVILYPDDDMHAFLVMPILYDFHFLPFQRVGEFTEAIGQFLQGLEFMHEHNIAHRDACRFNLMMDASKVIPKGFHYAKPYTHDGVSENFSWRSRWSAAPVQYYYIDFGLSSHYPPGLKDILDDGILGQDKTVPELSLTIPYDPFKVDVYQLGNVILRVIAAYEGLEIFQALGIAMTRPDPKDRPTASEALKLFKSVVLSLKRSGLRRRIWKPNVSGSYRFCVQYLGYCGW